MFLILLTAANSVAITYTVRSGDTLTSIAQLFSVTIAQIQEWNGISNPDFITVGQVLNIKEAKRTYVTYTVKSGDSLSVIAANYGLTTEDLAISNMKAYPYTLYVGEVLLIPVPLPTPSRSPTASPSKSPTATPSKSPTASPSKSPTATPSKTFSPTEAFTQSNTYTPTEAPPPSSPTPAPTPLPSWTTTVTASQLSAFGWYNTSEAIVSDLQKCVEEFISSRQSFFTFHKSLCI
ncbi:LysM peptidoglycan-binding domain-containing protein [Histomonas meleagridis]|uniref:LysM peptidoglycan-binding domain-containing protein n=1 Tax=Histomonas meleagridis TaxID=135588 RepID=UPI0035593DEE|nr:LysM peptidoglycan-binding domain-containing protein [Histomonas meleagridis]